MSEQSNLINEAFRILTFEEFVNQGREADDFEIIEAALSTDEDFLEFLGLETTPIILEKAMSAASGEQPWADEVPRGIDRMSYEQIEEIILSIVYPAIPDDLKYYERVLKRIAGKVKDSKPMIAKPKPVKSIISKIMRGKKLERMHDIIRGTIIVKSPEQMDDVHKYIKKYLPIWEIEEKKMGDDPDFGYYGSMHYKVELPDGNLAEIQVMPRSLHNVKGEAHKIYAQLRTKISREPEFKKTAEYEKARRASKRLFSRGQGRRNIAVEVPQFDVTDS
jgi:hypothetical protein